MRVDGNTENPENYRVFLNGRDITLYVEEAESGEDGWAIVQQVRPHHGPIPVEDENGVVIGQVEEAVPYFTRTGIYAERIPGNVVILDMREYMLTPETPTKDIVTYNGKFVYRRKDSIKTKEVKQA